MAYTLGYHSFWVIKLQSDTQCKLILLTAAMYSWKFLRKCSSFTNKRNFVFLHDNVRPHSARIIPGVSFTPSTILTRPCTKWFPSFLLSTKCSECQKFFSSRPAKNIWRKLLELKTYWILFERNQQSTWERWFIFSCEYSID